MLSMCGQYINHGIMNNNQALDLRYVDIAKFLFSFYVLMDRSGVGQGIDRTSLINKELIIWGTWDTL